MNIANLHKDLNSLGDYNSSGARWKEKMVQYCRIVKINDHLEILVCKCTDPNLSRESGWWISREFNPQSLSWVDHARPGYGVTYWITKAKAVERGLEA